MPKKSASSKDDNLLNGSDADHKAVKNSKECKKDGKKNTSLRLDRQTLKLLKLYALENDTSVQKIIEHLINDFLEKESKR